MILNSNKFYHRTTCRLCTSSSLEIAIPYPATPIADDYITSSHLFEIQERFPLDLYLCLECGHMQLCDVVDARILFENYTYESSISLGLVEHFRKYADEMIRYSSCSYGSLIVEIGSNDGSLLRFFKKADMIVLGIDPAKEIAKKANNSGIDTIPDFFSSELAKAIKSQKGQASIIAANNVFAHSDNLSDMADGIHELLDKEGIFIFEVSYLPDIIENKLIDTIYHEHLCYHSVKPLQHFLRKHCLELIDFIRIPTKGGSFRGIAKRTDGQRPVMPSVFKQIDYERMKKYDKIITYRIFVDELQKVKEELNNILIDIKKKSKIIAGYGSSATVTTLIYYFDLYKYLDFLVDDNPRKHNTYSPGYHLPVFPSQSLYEKKPEYVLILAWTYEKQIREKNQEFINNGGKFIIPLPVVKVL